MPGRICTPQERKRLDAFPSEIGEADLIRFHASILAQACNFGLTRMAQLADLSYRQHAWRGWERSRGPCATR